MNGGPAFPATKSDAMGEFHTEGMTLRDYFAAKALAGPAVFDDEGYKRTPGQTAELAYRYADAMLAARVEPESVIRKLPAHTAPPPPPPPPTTLLVSNGKPVPRP